MTYAMRLIFKSIKSVIIYKDDRKIFFEELWDRKYCYSISYLFIFLFKSFKNI